MKNFTEKELNNRVTAFQAILEKFARVHMAQQTIDGLQEGTLKDRFTAQMFLGVAGLTEEVNTIIADFGFRQEVGFFWEASKQLIPILEQLDKVCQKLSFSKTAGADKM